MYVCVYVCIQVCIWRVLKFDQLKILHRAWAITIKGHDLSGMSLSQCLAPSTPMQARHAQVYSNFYLNITFCFYRSDLTGLCCKMARTKQTARKKKQKRMHDETHNDKSRSQDAEHETKKQKVEKCDESADNIDDKIGSEAKSVDDPDVIEKKRKKEFWRRKKEEQRQEALALIEEEESNPQIAQTAALQYVRKWKNKRGKWRFNKNRQIWILKNMHLSEKVRIMKLKNLLDI